MGIVESNNVPIDKIVRALKGGGPATGGIVELIKAADLDIDDFYCEDPGAYGGAGATAQQSIGAKARGANRQSSADGRGLVSVHRGGKFPAS
ncbi:MAG: hypothetical protein LUD47_05440 [Clostridia bacterium]|nr:hypothetical protein [Clostridia bacterium]